MSEPSGSRNIHFFQGSSHLQFNNPQFNTTINGPGTSAQANSFEIQCILDAEVAPNAILNAGGRVDIPKCHPGTREEVISKAEHWMAGGYRLDRRIFWLSGPAGAGKSAIVQTLAERCIERNALMANFFFFRADSSRNHSRPVVATLLRQLMKSLPELKALVIAIIAEDSLIFETSLREQFMTLIDAPIRKIRQGTPDAPPIILLIDGLDECDSRPDLDNATISEQRTLLNALHELETHPNSFFVVLVASRVESHIRSVFNGIGCTASSIYLDENYQPDTDIRLYVSAELSRIKDTHPLGHYLPSDWPSTSTINSIIKKSSGQFIYASTVVRFTENSSQSPAMSLEMILSIHTTAEYSPFAEIDALCMFILARCKAWVLASKVIAMNEIYQVRSPWSSLGYSSKDQVASSFSDLTSIIKTQTSDYSVGLTFYHASFNDFIYSPERAGRFYIDLTSYANSLAPRAILAISGYGYGGFRVAVDVLWRVTQRSKALTDALMQLPANREGVNWEGGRRNVKNDFLAPVKDLYAQHDPDLYRQIFNHMQQQNWIPANVYLSDKLDLCKKPKWHHRFWRLFQ